ncbi:MAG: hypothetical protein JO103_03400, partial [Candidatus Eremiobacteraeota bacterium]|nr:hypothetical protein [Candidatus Eremiobacteraeota bacterium]
MTRFRPSLRLVAALGVTFLAGTAVAHAGGTGTAFDTPLTNLQNLLSGTPTK